MGAAAEGVPPLTPRPRHPPCFARARRFKRRFAGLDSLATVETVSGQRAAAAAAKEAAAAANN